MKTIGILTLQGDFARHFNAVEQAGGLPVPVRSLPQLERTDGLIIPGGESTTIGKLLDIFEITAPLTGMIRDGFPVFGTCAGLILLSNSIFGSDQPRLGGLNTTVLRNAYGRQKESFEADISVPVLGGSVLRGVFIRAPKILEVGDDVEILAVFGDAPVFVRQGSIMGMSFHPELTGDIRVHSFFIRSVESKETTQQV
jgi:pyridoxal 5'-phosphate synthase pdxT subunit